MRRLLFTLILIGLTVPVVFAQEATTWTETIMYSFPGQPGPASPHATVTRDAAGNLYGPTMSGGAYNNGALYKLDTNGTLTVLYSFTGGVDGAMPHGALILDTAGNLYGTTEMGGAYDNGTVFKLDTTNTLTVLYSFAGGADGSEPSSSVTRDAAGNIYGTTYYGGGGPCDDGTGLGCGTVFELDTNGTETVLHSFTGADGANPHASVTRDGAGNLYGATLFGGANNKGVLFKVTPATRGYNLLYSFTNGADGANPHATPVRDKVGNLYGDTLNGGSTGHGTVYKLDLSGKLTALHTFNGADGANPHATLVRDAAGNLYGSTWFGGDHGDGVVFMLNAASLKFRVLYSFTGGTDGRQPGGGVIRDPAGNLYGTTLHDGAHGKGTVFKITPF
jgi:uncharacterized repeat protein (TIGR03803 family)